MGETILKRIELRDYDLILYRRADGEYVIHHEHPESGSRFWGRYFGDDGEKALERFNEMALREGRV